MPMMTRRAEAFRRGARRSTALHSFSLRSISMRSSGHLIRVRPVGFDGLCCMGIDHQWRSVRLIADEERQMHREELKQEESRDDAQPAKSKEPPMETVMGKASKYEFQAETRKLLDIVARSLYTDREIFVRELVSNASDALEKLRYRQSRGLECADPDVPLKISITTDETTNTLVIQDTGVGMSEQELTENLGTIARSGTQSFLEANESNAEISNIIGQFGVGFYSVFMVANKVEVFSRSAELGAQGYCWSSDGSGSYEIAECTNVGRGTKIVIHLNNDSKQFAKTSEIEGIIKRHSNFVSFDIDVGAKKVNTVTALWTKDPKEVTDNDHKEFYQFISHAYDSPKYKLHFKTDFPLNIQSIFYVPPTHMEKFGMGQMDPGVSLFCRRVMIQRNMTGLLPQWLRFVKGVVDCEDIPLNLSREHLQDNQYVRQVGEIVTRQILKWLNQEAKKDPAAYNSFFAEFDRFIKEGLVTDATYKEELMKLLRTESSKSQAGEVASFEEYIARMKPSQDKIYYLVTPKRSFAESSPYFEAFKKKDLEVLFLYNPIDDFLMGQLGEFKGKKIESVETAQIEAADKEDKSAAGGKLTEDEVKAFNKWIKSVLDDKVSLVRPSTRLVSSPAIIMDTQAGPLRRMMKFADPQRAPTLPKQELEYNPSHSLMRAVFEKRETEPEKSRYIMEQVFDNALILAGLMDDSREMLPRLEYIMQQVIGEPSCPQGKPDASSASPSLGREPEPCKSSESNDSVGTQRSP